MPSTPLFASNIESPTVTRLVLSTTHPLMTTNRMIFSPSDENDSSFSKLDREVARSFLNAPSNTISYASIPMRTEHNRMVLIPPQPSLSSSMHQPCLTSALPCSPLFPQPHPNAQLAVPPHTNIVPIYYDVIIDTVTDYDIFYPVAQQTEKYFYNDPMNEQHSDVGLKEEFLSTPSILSVNPIVSNVSTSCEDIRRVDELAVSIDFPRDYDPSSSTTTNWYNHPIDNQQLSQYERQFPAKNVRFDDTPSWIPYATSSTYHQEKNDDPLAHQYYFYPEDVTQSSSGQSKSVRYINTPFFWFRPVVNQNYAICIPTTRPSLHAYIATPLMSSKTNDVRF